MKYCAVIVIPSVPAPFLVSTRPWTGISSSESASASGNCSVSAPIGQVGVLLAAQEEVVTIPHVLRVREMDAKIGGIDMERLRRWYRQAITLPRGW